MTQKHVTTLDAFSSGVVDGIYTTKSFDDGDRSSEITSRFAVSISDDIRKAYISGVMQGRKLRQATPLYCRIRPLTTVEEAK